ncbi:ParB/RepB/Spo0J family partition protein [Phytohalomonas tamaricis]|uniref:ParB/RepB/Spo0J family partition protein n=1 Tax=Phytohalomonas tamaricis TaxID=2081032 RepID=UPI000D0B1A47|nr:ParB/RepB/Spo0J family partition protein [Phytohalomonas tamaricis]
MAISDLRSLSELARKTKTKAGKEVLTLNTDDVVAKGDQVRKQFEGIEELANSLRVNGQIQPIIVYPRNEEGKYIIQKGERRWRAACMAGLSIEAIVDGKPHSPLDETAGELVENIQRDALTPLEIAAGLQKFVEQGWKKKQIAEKLGKTASYVSSHLALLKMPDGVLELYNNDISRDPETLNNLRQLYEISPTRAEQAYKHALANGIGRKQSREFLNAAKQEISDTRNPIDTSTTDESEQPFSTESKDIEETEKAKKVNEDTKQKKKSISQPVEKPNMEDNTWVQAVPSNIRCYVSVSTEEHKEIGYLATDRVDQDREYCWVIINDLPPRRVPIASVELMYIET